MGYGKADCVVACCGDFRGDGLYGPGDDCLPQRNRDILKPRFQGLFTLKDLMTILPFDDPTIVLELDAKALWDTVEHGLSTGKDPEGCVM